MPLLVHRDPLYLVEREGKVEAVKQMPDFLSKSPLATHKKYVYTARQNYGLNSALMVERNVSNLLISDEDVFASPREHGFPGRGIPALWSGYRSCVVQDKKTKQLYRLKGIRSYYKEDFRERGDFITIEGGQLEDDAENERIFSNKFNEALQREGIEPAMEFIGTYLYPTKVRGLRLSTSIMSVKGDTRLDELCVFLDMMYSNLLSQTKMFRRFEKPISQLYYDLGFIVGRFKKLMTLNEQSWSANLTHWNHHLGNVVLYHQDNDLCVGFVDFESSCDLRDKSKRSLNRQIKSEFEELTDTSKIISTTHRPLRGIYFTGNDRDTQYRLTEFLSKGIIAGYTSNYKKFNNKIESHRLEEIVSSLQKSIARASNRNPSL